jgi:peptide/nickel transport system substrate-binding protein
LVQVWLLGLLGCAREKVHPQKGKPVESEERIASEPRPDVLRIQVDYLPAQLNPLVSLDIWCQRVTLHTLFEPLVTVGREGAVGPHLAAKMEVKNGGRLFIFRLRPKVQFHDGRPLTSADVKFTLEKLIGRNPPSEMLKSELADVAEIRDPEPQTVEIMLQRPNYLLPAVLAEVGIMPAHLYNRFGLRNPKLNWMPVGTGPYRAESRKDKDTLTLVRNERYWGHPARISRLIFISIGDPARALTTLRNGELDILSSLHSSYYPEQISASRLKSNYQTIRIHPYRLRVMLYNHRHRVLRDRRVRLAIERLTDRDRLVRTVRHQLGQVLSAPLWPLSRWIDATIHPRSYERPAAAKLLDQAGWQDPKGTGKRQRAGVPLKLKILRSRESSEMDTAAQMLRVELRAAGIEAEVETADFGYLKTQLRRGRFEIALIGLAPRPEEDLSLMLHSKGELNYGGYSNPMVDALLESMRNTAGLEERQRSAQRLHRLLYEDPPFTVLYAPIELMMVHRRIKGLANNGRWPRLSSLYWD